MKTILLPGYIIFFCFLMTDSSITKAQNPLFPGIQNLQRSIIVKDSNDRIYNSTEWLKLTTTYQYKFNLIDSNSETLVYRLVKMNGDEKKEIFRNIQPEETTNFKTGDTIASFALKDTKGNKYQIDTLKGKIVILYFCILKSPATTYEIPELNELYAKYGNRSDVVFLAITSEDKWTSKEIVKRTNFKFPVCYNAESVMDQLDISAWPTHVVLDRKGKIQLHNRTYNPQLSVFWISDKIEELLKEEN